MITSEFDLYKHHLRGVGLPLMVSGLIGGRTLGPKEAHELKLRWKTLGFAFSTGRMTMRFMGWIDNLTFFLRQLKLFLTRDKKFNDATKL